MADRYSVVFTKHQLDALQTIIDWSLEDLGDQAYISTSKSRALMKCLENCSKQIAKKERVQG